MRTKNKIRLYVLIFFIVCIVGLVSYFTLKNYYHTDWTFAFYLSGNNDLEREESKNFIEIVRGKKYAKNANLIVFLDKDGTLSNDHPMTVWTGTRVFEVNSNYENTIDHPLSIGIASPGEGNFNLYNTPGETMRQFFSFVMDHYPADRYAFFISGHGNGWFFENTGGPPENAVFDRSRVPFKDVNPVNMVGSGDICPVDIDPMDIATALQHNRPDVLVLDMCLMADIETLFQLRSCTDYLVANQTTIPSTTLDYSLLFKRLKSGKGFNPERLAMAVVNTYESSYRGSQYTITSIAVRFGKNFNRFMDDFNRFVLTENNQDRLERMEKSSLRIPRWNDTSSNMIDLVQFINSSRERRLMSYMPGKKHSFIAAKFSNRSPYGGVSIYLPENKNNYLNHKNEYNMLDISKYYPEGWTQQLERKFMAK